MLDEPLVPNSQPARRLVLQSALFAAAVALSQAAALAQLTEISLANGRLTVRATAVPVTELIDQLSRAGAMEVSGQSLLTGSLSATIENETVPAALTAILKDFDYVLSSKLGVSAADTIYVVRILRRHRGASTGSAGSNALVIPALEAARFSDHRPDADPDDLAGAEADTLAEETDLLEKESTGAFGSSARFDDLLLDVDDGNPLIRLRVLEALIARDPRQALPHLVTALGDDDPRVADYVVDQLGGLEDSASLRQIGDASAKAADSAVRLGALRVFALRADRASVPYVKALLKDENETVREAASQLIVALMEKSR